MLYRIKVYFTDRHTLNLRPQVYSKSRAHFGKRPSLLRVEGGASKVAAACEYSLSF